MCKKKRHTCKLSRHKLYEYQVVRKRKQRQPKERTAKNKGTPVSMKNNIQWIKTKCKTLDLTLIKLDLSKL